MKIRFSLNKASVSSCDGLRESGEDVADELSTVSDSSVVIDIVRGLDGRVRRALDGVGSSTDCDGVIALLLLLRVVTMIKKC